MWVFEFREKLQYFKSYERKTDGAPREAGPMQHGLARHVDKSLQHYISKNTQRRVVRFALKNLKKFIDYVCFWISKKSIILSEIEMKPSPAGTMEKNSKNS